jgi:hypothetical protein
MVMDDGFSERLPPGRVSSHSAAERLGNACLNGGLHGYRTDNFINRNPNDLSRPDRLRFGQAREAFVAYAHQAPAVIGRNCVAPLRSRSDPTIPLTICMLRSWAATRAKSWSILGQRARPRCRT